MLSKLDIPIPQYQNRSIPQFQDNRLRYHARMGIHAKRTNVRFALWMMRAVFSISDLGPRDGPTSHVVGVGWCCWCGWQCCSVLFIFYLFVVLLCVVCSCVFWWCGCWFGPSCAGPLPPDTPPPDTPPPDRASKHHQKTTRRPPETDKKSKHGSGKKKREILGSPPFGPLPFGARFVLGLGPFGPHHDTHTHTQIQILANKLAKIGLAKIGQIRVSSFLFAFFLFVCFLFAYVCLPLFFFFFSFFLPCFVYFFCSNWPKSKLAEIELAEVEIGRSRN